MKSQHPPSSRQDSGPYRPVHLPTCAPASPWQQLASERSSVCAAAGFIDDFSIL